ncbi:hypothetical protein [Butyrivibrio sp. INlla14]|uniref:hypothetical protein n=1 Tax=Butyrivibrio sp. INlla14 TaxID=1520808 RepID=UPI00087669FA|nr:hypothetical protein [Butyrivibrio sp. INlla14]SCY51862.1 hypothetical protein SAMN02910371_02616 [Butyrivibrio sp. INlla14]
MKKNLLNKQLIKAISLGISASMALQPVTALAAEETNAETSDNTGDHVLEVENTIAEETIIENSEAAISNAKEEIENAEKETGLTFDNSDDEVVAVTGEVESAVETVIDAKNDIEDAKEHSANRDKAIEEMNNNLDQNYGSNIDKAKTDFNDATTAAGEAEEISASITEETVLADAESKAKEANAKHKEALEKLANAEKEYADAKAAYDKAFENYRKASEEGSKSFISINDAQRELEEAMKMLSQKKEVVENQTAAAAGYLETVKNNDYQKIADSLEKLSKNETTSEEHAKLLIGAYIKANGGKDVAFGTVNKEYTAGLNENGEVKKETQTYNTVTYTNADGEEVVESYIVNVDENGEISVSKINVSETDNTDVIIKEAVEYSPAVEGKDEVLESWSTADGSKSFLVSNDKIVKIETENENELIAIDTENLNDVSTEDDKKVSVPAPITEYIQNGVKTTKYVETGLEKTEYVKDTYVVVDSYNTKRVTDSSKVETKEELFNMISNLEGRNDNVSVNVSVQVAGFLPISYNVYPNDLKWYDKLNAVLFGSGYKVDISYDVEDKNSPKETHEEEAICEVVTKEYTITTVTNVYERSGNYGWLSKDKKSAKRDMEARVSELRDQGFTVNSFSVESDWNSRGKYYYKIDYTSTNVGTNTVTKEVSRKRYAADTYTVHTEHQDAVEAKDEVQAQAAVYGTKLVTTTAGSFVENDLQAKLEAQANAVALQNAAVEAAKAAEEAYNNAVKAVKDAQEKVEKLKEANTPVVTLAEASANLNIAMKRLSEATSKKNAADKAVANATTAVENANKNVSFIQAKEAARKAEEARRRAEEEARRNQENNSNDGQSQSSDSASEYATVIPTVANTTKKTAATTLETAEVLGAKRATTKKATKATKTSTKKSTDKVSEEKKDTKLAAEEKAETVEAVETTEAVVTPSEDVKTTDGQNVDNAEVTIADEQTALTDSVENAGQKHFPWIVVAILGVLGISVEEVVRRGSKKAKEKSKKD